MKDPSVTIINHPGLSLQASEQELRIVRDKSEKVLKHNASRSVVDLYNKDLGTMGIPRDVAQQRANVNFLFLNSNDPAPGSYDPVKP